MDIYPAIDLRGGKVVRLLQGDYDRQIDYADDPAAVARSFADQGARRLHVVDLDGARGGVGANADAVGRIAAESRLSVQVGGGVRSADAVERLLAMGVARVVIGTRAVRDWGWFVELVGRPAFARRVLLGLDARGGMLAVEGWTEATALSAIEVARRADPLPLAGLICTDIATDGMMAGPNFEAIGRLVAATRLPIIASGGVSSVEDVRRLAGLGAAGAIIGRSLYEGRITLPAALAAASPGA